MLGLISNIYYTQAFMLNYGFNHQRIFTFTQ